MAPLVERDGGNIRSFDPYRDLKPVVELIDVAFGKRLDTVGKIALEELRRAARWGAVWWWLRPLLGSGGIAPGFVWIEEDDKIVGNVSLRRASAPGGFMIGNVVVHPEWRRRGIARALMEVALDDIAVRGGQWVGLEVRADNQVALHLYDTLGFREVGSTLHMLRPAGTSWDGEAPKSDALRCGRHGDRQALTNLVRAMIPKPQRPLLEVQSADYQPGWLTTVERWLEGRHEVWWVIEEAGRLVGAVRAIREWGHRPNRLEPLTAPDQAEHLGPLLARKGLASLKGSPDKLIETVLPHPAEAMAPALRELGFKQERQLIQMRKDLTHHIVVKAPGE